MSLMHIMRVKPEVVYCGHPAPDLFVYSEGQASCADCIKLYLQEGIDELRRGLEAFVLHRNPVPHSSKLWAVTAEDMDKAEAILGTPKPTRKS